MNNKNRGTGAGGNQTNINGKNFENNTDNKVNNNPLVMFYTQRGLNKFLKLKYKLLHFRNPDEAYIISNIGEKPILIILEKKNQNSNGSVEDKLWAGPSFKREYELTLGHIFFKYYI